MNAPREIVDIDLAERSYPIVIGAGLLTDPELLDRHVTARDVLVVTNETIAPLYLQTLTASLGRRKVSTLVLKDGEQYKTLDSFRSILDALIEARFNRDSTIIALGGGVVGDMSGFAAACYQRGIDYIQVPTTLLAQVDSSVGGKTAVNHPKAKNMIGAFYQPRAVIADIGTLATLPIREFRAGLAEVVKHGIVLERAYFDEVERDRYRLLGRDLPVLERIIGGSCRLKAAVIERDPEEKSDLRFALNYGHTVGHALEAATGFTRWTHGEAVALGIVAEARLARRLKLADDATVAPQERLLASLGLPVHVGTVDVEAVLGAITHDKKARDGRVPFVLAPRLGEFKVVRDVPPDDVRAVLHELAGEARG